MGDSKSATKYVEKKRAVEARIARLKVDADRIQKKLADAEATLKLCDAEIAKAQGK